MCEAFHYAFQHHLGEFGKGKVKDQQKQKILHAPVTMGLVGEFRLFRATQFAGPIDNVFDAKQK